MTPAIVRNYRHKQGWTQSQLAAVLGVSRATVNNWESGVHYPKEFARQSEQLQKLDYLLEQGTENAQGDPVDLRQTMWLEDPRRFFLRYTAPEEVLPPVRHVNRQHLAKQMRHIAPILLEIAEALERL